MNFSNLKAALTNTEEDKPREFPKSIVDHICSFAFDDIVLEIAEGLNFLCTAKRAELSHSFYHTTRINSIMTDLCCMVYNEQNGMTRGVYLDGFIRVGVCFDQQYLKPWVKDDHRIPSFVVIQVKGMKDKKFDYYRPRSLVTPFQNATRKEDIIFKITHDILAYYEKCKRESPGCLHISNFCHFSRCKIQYDVEAHFKKSKLVVCCKQKKLTKPLRKKQIMHLLMAIKF